MHLRIFTEPQQGASYEALLAFARASEDRGFEGFFCSDHYLKIGDGNGYPGPTDAWVTLGALAVQTSRIRLGTLVTPITFRLPGVLSVQVAQVDAMSDGRVELGLGAGWFREEHAAYGIPFPSNRLELLEEQLEIINGLWRTEDNATFSFDGKHYKLTNSPALPKPVQKPHPPIIIGGGERNIIPHLAAKFANEFNSDFRSIDETGQSFRRVHDACHRIGRDLKTIVLSSVQIVCCAQDDSEFARRAGRIGRDAGELRVNAIAGTPEEVAEKLWRFGEIGADRIYLSFADITDFRHLDLIAEKIVPQLVEPIPSLDRAARNMQ